MFKIILVLSLVGYVFAEHNLASKTLTTAGAAVQTGCSLRCSGTAGPCQHPSADDNNCYQKSLGACPSGTVDCSGHYPERTLEVTACTMPCFAPSVGPCQSSNNVCYPRTVYGGHDTFYRACQDDQVDCGGPDIGSALLSQTAEKHFISLNNHTGASF